jgi:hypothetical protein
MKKQLSLVLEPEIAFDQDNFVNKVKIFFRFLPLKRLTFGLLSVRLMQEVVRLKSTLKWKLSSMRRLHP